MSSKPNYKLMFNSIIPITNNYNKLKTGGNNPLISKAMRFSEIIKNKRSVTNSK